MPLSSRIQVIFIIVSAFPLYSETAFSSSQKFRDPPDCKVYSCKINSCTREMDPVCGTNGQTYSNRCVFCSKKLLSNETIEFAHYGKCRLFA